MKLSNMTRNILHGLGIVVLALLAAVGGLLAFYFAWTAAVRWLQVAADASGTYIASEIAVYSITATVAGFMAVALMRIIRMLNRSERPAATGIAFARAGWPGRAELVAEYGRDVVTLAEEMSTKDSFEDARRVAETLGEQIRSGRRLRPAEGVVRHEVAHALVATEVGFNVTEIRITPTHGHVSSDEIVTAITPDERWDALAVLIAGSVAADDFGCQNDITRALALATTMLVNGARPTGYEGELTVEGLITGARDRTREILARQADMFERVVVALQERGSGWFIVRGDELTELLAPMEPRELVDHVR